MSSFFSRFFPVPSFFTIPTAGLDFSDDKIRCIKLRENKSSLLPVEFAQFDAPKECIKNGKIVDYQKFANFLKEKAKNMRLKYVRVSIPETEVYTFTLSLDPVVKKDIKGAVELVLEENIPLKSSEAVFDYRILSDNKKMILVQVVAIASTVAEEYLSALSFARIVPVSFELESQAMARAILSPQDKSTSMIVDIGRTRSVISIVQDGTVVYASTIDFGGDLLVSGLIGALSIDQEEARLILKDRGLAISEKNKDSFLSIADSMEILKMEINKRIAYWYEKKNQYQNSSNISIIYLSGEYSTIVGLEDYLSAQLRLKVVLSNPWKNCLSLEEDIPSLPFEQSQSYLTSIGLALSDYIHD